MSGTSTRAGSAPITNIQCQPKRSMTKMPQQCGQHGTDVVARHHRGGRRTPTAPRRVLVDQCQRGRQHPAEAQPGQEPQQPEEPRVGRESAGEGQHRERDDRPQHRLPTADVVRDRAHRQRTDHHTQQADDGHQRRGVGRETPRLVRQEGGQYDPQYHEVETLQGHREPAQRRHPARIALTGIHHVHGHRTLLRDVADDPADPGVPRPRGRTRPVGDRSSAPR